jgi:hypothetical protein
MKGELESLNKSLPRAFSNKRELFSDTKGYYGLGVKHSLDIVNSMITRFEKGYAHNDEFFIKSVFGG